jgi:hypothetical protein
LVDVVLSNVEFPETTNVPPFKAPIVAVLILADVPEAVVNPSDEVKSEVEVTPTSVVFPVTFKVPATVSVPVTELDAAMNPPKNWAVVVVKEPRAITDWRVSRPTAAQFVPFARQTAMPPTKRLVVVTVVAERVPAFNELPVAFPKVSVPIEPMLEFKLFPVAEVKVRRPVAARFVAVVFASVEEPVTISVPPFKEPMVAKLILADVPEAVVNPSDEVKSEVEVTPTKVAFPVTFKLPATFKVPVTDEEAATNPPNKSTVVVVKFPRAVTVANVSEETVPAGQPTPLERQIAKPITVAVAKFPEFATIEEPLAVVNPSDEVKSEVEVTPTSVVLPVTFKAPATFKVPVTLDEAATNPPKNCAVVVVNDPRAVTDWRVSAPTAAQFVPSDRHTVWPEIVAVPKVAELAFNAVPVAVEKLSKEVTAKLVDVTLVPVAVLNNNPVEDTVPDTSSAVDGAIVPIPTNPESPRITIRSENSDCAVGGKPFVEEKAISADVPYMNVRVR